MPFLGTQSNNLISYWDNAGYSNIYHYSFDAYGRVSTRVALTNLGDTLHVYNFTYY